MQHYPLLPLRDIVVFPGMVVPLFVGREKSVAALEAAMGGSKDIFLLAQLDPGIDDPDHDDLYDTGVIAKVLQLLKLPDGTVRVLVEGHQRARLVDLSADSGAAAGASGPMLVAGVEPIEPEVLAGAEVSAMMRQVVEQFGEYAKLSKKLPQDRRWAKSKMRASWPTQWPPIWPPKSRTSRPYCHKTTR
jgi:ATP-dependent Lon protease